MRKSEGICPGMNPTAWGQVLFLSLSMVAGASAQALSNGSYSIRPLTINAGGLTSANGPYSVSSSVGQAGGVGMIANGPYSLEDGFWPGVQGAPAPEPTPSETDTEISTETPTDTPEETPTPTNTQAEPTPTNTQSEVATPTDTRMEAPTETPTVMGPNYDCDGSGKIDSKDLLCLLEELHQNPAGLANIAEFVLQWQETLEP